jgi:predicted RND superfamily exporter protein
VHYIYHYQWLKKRGDNAAEALEKTASHIGSAVVITGLFLFCGYALMMFGSLQTVQLFGLLTAIAIITGIFGELVIFPIMLKVLDDK